MKKYLARSSSNPGKTIRMDFFLINDSFYFIDFPGYGFSKHSAEIREKLAKMILWYLMYSEIKNRLIILVVDAKVGLTPYDTDILSTLYEYNVNHIIVANKIDNLKMDKKNKQLTDISMKYPNSEVIPFSSKQKHQSRELIRRIMEYIG
jgi:GTP-binding protein